MSSVDKMSIQGIRSYSPDKPSIIEFQKPLTLIVGANGAGKTTIIESLRYMATGDMPPGSKQQFFVHDPKVAGVQEVKGQIKLKFTDVSGSPIVVTRALSSTQKSKKIETKTLDGSISRVIHGEKTSISSRCADVNREMIAFLGVSRAVLDNVIFCHQEESNWPLSEGRVLKQKFDDIFAATRYIKALEEIQKFRKSQAAEVNLYKTDLTHLKNNRDKAAELEDEMEKTQEKIKATKVVIENVEKRLRPVESRLADLSGIADQVFQLEKEQESLTSTRKQLVKRESDLRDKITNVFNGPVEELHRIHADFQAKVRDEEERLRRSKAELDRFESQLQKLSGEQSRLQREHGKLEQQAQLHKQNVDGRDRLIEAFAKQFDIEGYERGPFSDSRVQQFMAEMKQLHQGVIDNTKQQRRVFQDKLSAAQRKIDEMKKSRTQYEETISLKAKLMRENQQKLREIGKELSNVDASANRLRSLEGELQRAERDLDEAQSAANVAELNAEVDRLQSDKRRVDGELRQLRDEQQAMHRQSSTQAKLDTLTNDKRAKEDNIQRIMERHEEDLNCILGSRGTAENLCSRLTSYMKQKRVELNQTRNRLQKIRQTLSSKQTRHKISREKVTELEGKADDYKKQLADACGENDYNSVKEELQESINHYTVEKSSIESLEVIYQRYIKKLQDSKVKDDGCPLCHRRFEANRQITELIAELRRKVAGIPAKRQEIAQVLTAEQQRYENILKLEPVKKDLEVLQCQKLPSIRTELKEMSTEIEQVTDEITEIEDVLSLSENEEQRARTMEPDIRVLDKYRAELKELDKNISLLQSKLHGVAPGRTMQAISREIEDRQDRSDTLNTHIDRKRSQASQLQQQLSDLGTTVHELKSQKLRLTAQLQRRSHLEEQKADLTSSNGAFEREIKEAESGLKPIKGKVDQYEEEKSNLNRDKEAADDQNRKQLSEIQTSGDKVREKTAEISRYITEGCDQALQDNEGRLKNLGARKQKAEDDKGAVSSRIDQLKNDVTKQHVRARELEDNIQLKSVMEEIINVDKKREDVTRQLESFGDHENLVREREDLERQSEALKKERANHEGRRETHEEEVKSFQRQLRSDMFKNAREKHRQKMIELKTTEMANVDLDRYHKALDRAIMKFHALKMAEINKIIKEYWINTYTGSDIDTIEIVSHDEDGLRTSGTRRTYNYRVVMVKGDTTLDMRGRCSAGQKVLASLIIRLALAETFCLNCGIFALDEPTTNLDEENIESLANQLAGIVRTRQSQRNFQLIVITHDENFVDLLGRADFVDYYYRVSKSDSGFSRISRQNVSELRREESFAG